jgi:uncharacterized repeat protein (TIGR01451 family)
LSTLHGFVYGPKLGLVDLGTLPGLPSLAPRDINDVSGLVVGVAASPPDASGSVSSEHAFVYNLRRHTAKDLGAAPGFALSAAQFVNDRGQVVGELGNTNSLNGSHVFFYDPARGLRDVGTLPGFDTMTPVALENNGRVIMLASNSQTQSVAPHAVEYIPGSGLKDLGALPNSITAFSNEPGSIMLTPPNKYGQSLLTVQGLYGDAAVYLDNLNTGQLVNLSSTLNLQLLGTNSTTRITDSGQLVVTAAAPSSNPNSSGSTYVATIDPRTLRASQSDLSVAISGLPPTAQQGDILTATITVTNNGPDLAKNTQLLEAIGPGLTPVSGGRGAAGATGAGARVMIPSLPNGASTSFTVKLRATRTGPTTLGATVKATGDPNLANNTAIASMAVSPAGQQA